MKLAELSLRAAALPAGGFGSSMRGGRECEKTVAATV